MWTYPLTLRRLMVLEQEGLWVIDTGSPVSFGDRESLDLGGRRFHLMRNFMGVSPEKLSDLLGFRVNGLLGNDVISGFYWVFDLPNGTTTLSTDTLALQGHTIQSRAVFGMPAIPVTVGEETMEALLDTGAELSYFPPELLNGCGTGEMFRDFNPAMGWFDVELHTLPVRIGNANFVLRAGAIGENLGLLRMTLSGAGASALIGNQIFRDHRIGYAPRRNLLVFMPPSARPQA